MVRWLGLVAHRKAGLKGKVKGPCATSNLHACFNTFLFKPRINRVGEVNLGRFTKYTKRFFVSR